MKQYIFLDKVAQDFNRIVFKRLRSEVKIIDVFNVEWNMMYKKHNLFGLERLIIFEE